MYLYIYDCTRARQSNAKRVAFTKKLYGFVYTWKTKKGVKMKRKPGLLDLCPGAEAVGDSAILVPLSDKQYFDNLFNEYGEILSLNVFEVVRET